MIRAASVGPVEGCTVVVSSAEAQIIEWTIGYVAPWWPVLPGRVEEPQLDVTVDVDPGAVDRLAEIARDAPTTECHLGALGNVVRWEAHERVVLCDEQGVTFAFEPHSRRLGITARDWRAGALAATRFVREAVRQRVERNGFVYLHASAVEYKESVVLFVGEKGSGKSAAALCMARGHGAALVANDRVLVDTSADPAAVLAFPASALVGLGLAQAMSLGPALAAQQGSERWAPNQTGRVSAAISASDLRPLFEEGRELKAEIMPADLATLGVATSAGCSLSLVIHPFIDADAERPYLANDVPRALGALDLIPGSSEPERYPDFLKMAGRSSLPPLELLAELDRVPAIRVGLTLDVDSNGLFLRDLMTRWPPSAS